jgi:hypothetical protein
MIEALISGERRGAVMADLAQTRMRAAGKMADLSMALTGRFTGHHALMCRLHLDRITIFDDAVEDLDAKIAPLVARYAREAELLKTLPGLSQGAVCPTTKLRESRTWTFRSVGVGTSSRTVRHRSWAGPIFQGCPRASGAVQRLGDSVGNSRCLVRPPAVQGMAPYPAPGSLPGP